MKDKKINKVFKQVLKAFVGEMLNPCKTFVSDVENCDTYEDLKTLLEDNADSVFDSIGGSFECEECEGKDEKIEELSDAFDELEGENICMESDLQSAFVPQSINEEYKLEAFKKVIDKFTVSELEALLD